MAQMLLPAQAPSLRARISRRPRRIPTVLAPALPALILLAITTVGTADPPAAGLKAQLHVTTTSAVTAR